MTRRLDQERAKLAFEHVRGVSQWKEDERRKYASIVYATPALLRSAGLSQTLHFVNSRPSDAQKTFVEHLAKHLARINTSIAPASDNTLIRSQLLEHVREANMAAYLRMTRETSACVQWYIRFIQGELAIQPGAANVDPD